MGRWADGPVSGAKLRWSKTLLGGDDDAFGREIKRSGARR